MVLARRKFLTLTGGTALALSTSVLPLGFAEAATPQQIRINDLYVDIDAEILEFSKMANGLNGKPIQVVGFMAPPLKPDLRFFVLADAPMATCPFCDTFSKWPSDILVVQLKKRQPVVDYNRAIIVNGHLEIGEYIDPDTGFVSRARIADADFDIAKAIKPCEFGKPCLPGA